MPTAPVLTTTAPIVLVIEDYADTRELISTVLRRKGYRVVEAEDGVEGLLKAKGTVPDLIIMDLALPEMDGVEAARHIHATPNLSKIPIFVVSAFVTQAVEADVRAAGCVEVFNKPFELGELLEKIGRHLAQKN